MHADVQAVSGHLNVQAILGYFNVQAILGHLNVQGLSGHLNVQVISGHLNVQAISGHFNVQAISNHLNVQGLSGHLNVQPILSYFIVQAILGHLNAEELDHCRCVCRFLHTAALTPTLWQRLCSKRWPAANIEAWMPRSSDLSVPLSPPPSSATPEAVGGAHHGVPRHREAASEGGHISGSSFVYGTPPEQRHAAPSSCHPVDIPSRQHSIVAVQSPGALSPAVAAASSHTEQSSSDHKARGAEADMAPSRSYASWREVYWALCELEPLVNQAVWSHVGEAPLAAGMVHLQKRNMRDRTVTG